MSARLFVDPARLAAGSLRIDGSDHHYLTRVRRIRRGDPVSLCDGAGREAPAEVIAVDGRSVLLDVGEPRAADGAARLHIAVALAPVKADRTEWAIQKLVELGVGAIHPVQAARSVVVPRGRRAAARIERYRAIAADAARQSQNPILPHIEPIAPLADAVATLAGAELKLALWEDARGKAPLSERLPASTPEGAALLIGPEGGLTADEIREAEAAGFAAVGMGPRILRAETAAVAAVSVLQHTLGDLG